MKPFVSVVLALAACWRPAEERAHDDLSVGHATADGVTIDVDGGLAAVRSIAADRIELWAQSPVLRLTIDAEIGRTITVVVHNALPDLMLVGDGVVATVPAPARARAFDVQLLARPAAFVVAPPDFETPGRFRVVAMADIQTALPTVHDVFARIAVTPDVRFVVSMGDLTERAEVEEYDLFEAQLAALGDIPYYTTIGNHELWADSARFRDRFGRASFQFDFRGVAFTFVDSGDAGIDPTIYDWLDDWLDAARDKTHVFLTHFPPIDPQGIRAGSFRSRREAHALLARLAAGGVDLTLYGHIHTLLPYENAGIPAWISGGGGATQVQWDGIGRHFLTVDLSAGGPIDVGVVRVD
jgi:hypothetical protein